MYGYFDVDFIDQFEEDLISTDRKSLNWTNDITMDLQKLFNIILRIATTKFRKLKENRKIENFQELTGYNPYEVGKLLPPNQREVAKNIFSTIIKTDGISNDESLDLIENIVDVLGEKTFEDYSEKLNTLPAIDNTSAKKLLNDWYEIEVSQLSKLSSGRKSTINQFERIIYQNSKDYSLISTFITKFPWLLFPRSTSKDLSLNAKRIVHEYYKAKID